MYVTDSTGRRLLDGIAGLWCVNIGHGRREMADAIARQVMDMDYYNPFGASANVPAAELGARLADLSPGSLNHVYYSCGGSTANDAAIRIVHFYFAMRGKPGKRKIISRNNAYHGRPMWRPRSPAFTVRNMALPRSVRISSTISPPPIATPGRTA